MATKKKKSPPRRRSAPASKKSAAPAPAAQAAKSGPSYWPLIAVLLAAGGIFYALNAHKASVTVMDNLPPARTAVPSAPAPSSAPAPAQAAAAAAGAPAPQKRASAPKAVLAGSAPTAWDRSLEPKVTFRVLRAEGQAAEVPIFNAKNKLVRKLVSEAGPAGPVSLAWDGKNAKGHPVAAGSYFVRLSGKGGDVIQELEVR